MDSWAKTTALPTIVPDHPTTEHITDFGTNTLWVVFIIMTISSAVFTFRAYQAPVQRRLLFQLSTFITVIAAISYYAMASGSGYTYRGHHVTHEHKHDIPDTHTYVYRQVYYARYVDWLFTTPLLLLDLALLAGLNGSNILNVIVADVIMILTGLFAAYGHTTRQKWGWYTISWIAFLTIIIQLAVNARTTVAKRSDSAKKLYLSLSIFTIVIWFAYPIIWAASEGTRKLTLNQEVLAYAVLDVLAKPVFGTVLLLAHRRTPDVGLTLDGAFSDGFGTREGALRVGDDDEA